VPIDSESAATLAKHDMASSTPYLEALRLRHDVTVLGEHFGMLRSMRDAKGCQQHDKLDHIVSACTRDVADGK
jgi:hypothetical protein